MCVLLVVVEAAGNKSTACLLRVRFTRAVHYIALGLSFEAAGNSLLRHTTFLFRWMRILLRYVCRSFEAAGHNTFSASYCSILFVGRAF